MLPTDEINAIRQTAEEWLPEDVTLSTSVETSDGGGGISTTPTVVWRGPGRLAPVMAEERAFADDVKAIADGIVTVPATCPVTERHTLTCAGIVYQIVGVTSPHSYQLHVRVAVVRAR